MQQQHIEAGDAASEEASGVGADYSVLTSLPLLHAPRVAKLKANSATAGRSLVPYAAQYPAAALLPDTSGSISRLQLFRLGLMYGTLHGIEAASAGDWGQLVPSWSIVEASAVQQLAVLLGSQRQDSEGSPKAPVQAWRTLTQASLSLRPQVDKALLGLSTVSSGNAHKTASEGTSAGVLSDLMLGQSGGNATQELLQKAAAVLQH
jgi:hypothetical protein